MEHQIGETISMARQNAHLTQEEFADRLGVTPQAVSKWERGQGLPDIALVEGICRILQIRADTLFGIRSGLPDTERGNPDIQKEIQTRMITDPVLLEIGAGLIEAVTEGIRGGALDEARKKLAAETGYLIPIVRIRDNTELPAMSYRIAIYDRAVCEKEETQEGQGAYQAMVEEIARVCREHYADILNKQMVKCMVDTTKELYPGIADGVCPEQISYLEVERLLRELIRMGRSVRDLIHILEYAEWEMLHESCRDIPKVAAAIAKKL